MLSFYGSSSLTLSNKILVLGKGAFSSFVVAGILKGIIAELVLNETITFSGQNEDNFPILSKNFCEDFYQGHCLNGGECYIVNVQEDENAVTCMCTHTYGGTVIEKFQWWMKPTQYNTASDYCQEKKGTSEIFVFHSEHVTKVSFF